MNYNYGNYVNYQGRLQKISGVDKTTVYLCSPAFDDKNYPVPIKHVKPILITEDWTNYYKTTICVEAYFFRYENYKKGIMNNHILKSTFGRKTVEDIELEIREWFNECCGAYSEILIT